MLQRIFTKKVFFYDLLEQHVQLSLKAAKLLTQCLAGDRPIDRSTLSAIKECEHEADEIVRKGIEAIHRVFITPFDRDLIHDLLVKLDDITDSIDAAADLIGIYKIDKSNLYLKDLSLLLESSVEQVYKGVIGLRNLGNGTTIKSASEQVGKIEHRADAMLGEAIGTLFTNRADPIEIIKYKEIYEKLEEGTDRCSDAADLLVSILLENA